MINFGKDSEQALPTVSWKGTEDWASMQTHLLLILILLRLWCWRGAVERWSTFLQSQCFIWNYKIWNTMIVCVVSMLPTYCIFALNCEAWQLCYRHYLSCQFRQVVVYAWNRKWKNALLSNSSKDLQLWILEKNLRCYWKWQRYCAVLHQPPGAGAAEAFPIPWCHSAVRGGGNSAAL